VTKKVDDHPGEGFLHAHPAIHREDLAADVAGLGAREEGHGGGDVIDRAEARDGNLRERALAQIPLSRFGAVDDIASAVAFLSSAEAGYISGQVLAVDGGMSM